MNIVAITLVVCMAAQQIAAQYRTEAEIGGNHPKGLPARPIRIHKAQPRVGTSSGQSPIISAKYRRPLPAKQRSSTSELIGELPSIPAVRTVRPFFNQYQQDAPSPTTGSGSIDFKPVSEETNDERDNLAQVVANLGAVTNLAGPTVTSTARNEPSGSLTPQPLTIHYKPFIHNTTPKSFFFEKEQDFHPVPIQYRPAKPVKPRKPHQQQIQEEVLEQKSAPRLHQPVRHHLPKQSYDSTTEKRKPVAQIIKKYRKDNDDGSITWGFENDDGSYKEEIIGADCITRGKYGFIDQQGIKREYKYETGILCDEQEPEEEEESGFVDYQENKLVLPSGKTIDLSNMGKKQARRPQQKYYN